MRGASKEIPNSFVLETTFQENGKTFQLFHDPSEKDCTKAYIKKEIDA